MAVELKILTPVERISVREVKQGEWVFIHQHHGIVFAFTAGDGEVFDPSKHTMELLGQGTFAFCTLNQTVFRTRFQDPIIEKQFKDAVKAVPAGTFTVQMAFKEGDPRMEICAAEINRLMDGLPSIPCLSKEQCLALSKTKQE